jgi:hypothetical protein
MESKVPSALLGCANLLPLANFIGSPPQRLNLAHPYFAASFSDINGIFSGLTTTMRSNKRTDHESLSNRNVYPAAPGHNRSLSFSMPVTTYVLCHRVLSALNETASSLPSQDVAGHPGLDEKGPIRIKAPSWGLCFGSPTSDKFGPSCGATVKSFAQQLRRDVVQVHYLPSV